MITADRPLMPLGFDVEPSVAVVASLPSVPTRAAYVYLQAQGGATRWRDDGTDPDSTTGHILANGEDLWYLGDLSKFRFCKSSGEADHNISASYYEPK